MQALIDLCAEHLPLKIREASWDEETLLIKGTDWTFTTKSAWRIIDKKSIVTACDDGNVFKRLNDLRRLEIIDLRSQGSTLLIDPVFGLSNQTWLEVFSIESLEPWTLKLPNGKLFLGNS